MLKKSISLIFASIIIFSVLFTNSAYAIPISPDKYFFDYPSSEFSSSQELKIYGMDNFKSAKTLYVYVLGMRKIGEENDREFYVPTPGDYTEVANWISLGKTQFDITPSQTVTIPWTISKKGNAVCGTNLAAIVVATSPQEIPQTQKAIVTIKSEVVSQVHVNVNLSNGKTCDNSSANLDLLDFKINTFPIVFTADNVPFLTRIQNNGDYISRSPMGYIDINGFGGKVTIPFNTDQLDIYPHTIRKFDNNWLDPNYPVNGNYFEQVFYEISHLRIGPYEARLGITKNANPQIISTINFWIIPWRTLSFILILIIICVILLIRRKRKNDESPNYKKLAKKGKRKVTED